MVYSTYLGNTSYIGLLLKRVKPRWDMQDWNNANCKVGNICLCISAALHPTTLHLGRLLLVTACQLLDRKHFVSTPKIPKTEKTLHPSGRNIPEMNLRFPKAQSVAEVKKEKISPTPENGRRLAASEQGSNSATW